MPILMPIRTINTIRFILSTFPFFFLSGSDQKDGKIG